METGRSQSDPWQVPDSLLRGSSAKPSHKEGCNLEW